MHFTKAKGILSLSNGMNLYRGCSQGCIYCDSRSKCYHIEHDFEDIEIKENALELLENALKRKRSKCMLGTGSMTDPYILLESEIGNVRKAIPLHWSKFRAENLESQLMSLSCQEPQGLFGINIYNTDETDSRKFEYLIAVPSSCDATEELAA